MTHPTGTLSPWRTGWNSKCPRCGEGPLYDGFLKVADHCTHCQLDYTFENVGDGAVPFLITIIGFIAVGVALWILFAFDAPLWLPIVLTIPVIVVLTLYLLPKSKGVLIALQWVNKASDTGTDIYDER